MKRAVRRITLVWLAVFAILQIASATAFAKVRLPDPTNSFYVYDEPSVLSLATEEHIVSVNEKLNELCGAQIVIACVNTTGDEDIADYAYRLFNKWEIGSEEHNNGVLVLMSIQEDDYYALQGTGLEDLLSSGTLKLMLDESLEPYFAAGNYDAGATAIFDRIVTFVEDLYSLTPEQVDNAVVSSSTVTVPAAEQNTLPFNYDDSEDFSMFGMTNQFIHAFGSLFRFLITVAFVIFVIRLLTRRRRGGRGGFFTGTILRGFTVLTAGRFLGSLFGGHAHRGPRGGGGRPFGGGGPGRGASFGGGFHTGPSHHGGGGFTRGGGAGRR